MCDDYFEPGQPLEQYYRTLAERADLVTASSRLLASAIEDATNVKPHLVRDPYEGAGGAVRWAPAGRHVKALWFGTPFNLESLLAEAAALPPKIRDYTLEIKVLTRECAGLVDGLRKLSERSGAKLRLQFQEWSLDENWAALRACDLTVIPVKQGARFFQAKGPNRLVETLRAGRFAAAHPMPAYDEFKPWVWPGDIDEGIAWSLDHPAEVVARIAAAQAYIEQHYSPAAIAAEWEAALGEAVRRGAGPPH